MQVDWNVWASSVLLLLGLFVAVIFSSRIFKVDIRGCTHTHDFKLSEFILYWIIKKFGKWLQFQADCFLVIYDKFNWDLCEDPTAWQLITYLVSRVLGFLLMKMALKYFYVQDLVMGEMLKYLQNSRRSRRGR